MGKIIESLAEQAGGAVIGTAMGLMMEKHNDERQIRQQQRLTDMELAANKQIAGYNYDRQLQMWKDTNYEAQVRELEKAGLNPALLYGMGGGGGTTTGSGGGNISGGKAPSGGGEVLALQQQALQMGIQRAQIENIKADTENKKAETPNIPLTGKEIQARTMDLLQGVESKKAQQALTNVETAFKNLELSLAEDTYEDTKDQIHYTLQKSKEELQILKYQRELDGKTLEDKAKKIHAEAIGASLTNELIKSHTNLNKEQITKINAEMAKWAQEISQGWEGLTLQRGQLSETTYHNNTQRMQAIIQNKLAEFQINNPEIWKQLGGGLKAGGDKINKVVDEINKISNLLRTGKYE